MTDTTCLLTFQKRMGIEPTMKILFLFWALWFLNFSVRTIISPILPLIEDDLTINHALAGGLYFAFYVGNTIALFSSGFLSFRIGYKRSVLFGLLLIIISFFTLRFADNYKLFAGILFFLGLGSGIYLPCAIPLITAIIDRDHWGKAISFHETAASFSILAIPFIVIFVMRFFHWRSLFILMSAACFIAAIFLVSFSPDPRPGKEKQARFTHILRKKDFWIITVLWISCSMASLGIYNIIPLYLVKERGIQIETANTLFGISRIGGFIAMILMGFILDRFSIKKILLFTLLTTGLFTLGISVAHTFWLLVSILMVQATFSVVFFPVGIVAIARLTRLSERSVFTGILMGISGMIGPGLSPMILGAIADAWNFQAGILIVGIWVSISSLTIKALHEI